MVKKIISLSIVLFAAAFIKAQTGAVIISGTVLLPRDTIVKRQLIVSINDFLSQISKANNENSSVTKSDLLETSLLIDEMKNVTKSAKFKIDTFYKPYLVNLIQNNDSNFLLQLSYMAVAENEPLLRASFTLLAEKNGNKFYFRSPLKQNTILWKAEKLGNVNVYYKNDLNIAKAKEYFKAIADFDQKLSAPAITTDFYCADNFHEVLQLIGIDYKSDFNGYLHSAETGTENNHFINVNGSLTARFTEFDPHDLWHSRLHRVIPIAIINKPVDEGTAYLYGGSWELSWKEILQKFKIYAAANANADWLALYNESKNFDEHAKYPLNVDFMINALLVQKIEKEKGFPAVVSLLSCGKKQDNNENYFKALEQITGITKKDFNSNIQALIKASWLD